LATKSIDILGFRGLTLAFMVALLGAACGDDDTAASSDGAVTVRLGWGLIDPATR
jgi:hypothetical protein